MQSILVIKLGALGDFMFSLAAMQSLRRQHPQAQITCFTRREYGTLARQCGLFDTVVACRRPKWGRCSFNLWLRLRLIALLLRHRFDCVYDLQCNITSWSGLYKPFCRRSLPWVRLGPGSRPHPLYQCLWSGTDARTRLVISRRSDRDNEQHLIPHRIENHGGWLYAAGITSPLPLADLRFTESLPAFEACALPSSFVLLIAGGNSVRRQKIWPWHYYAGLAKKLAAHGLTPVLVGTRYEAKSNRRIVSACPAALDLTGQTVLSDLFDLARKARIVIGNDTGPMHMALHSARKSVMIATSAKAVWLGRFPRTGFDVVSAGRLEDVSVDQVFSALGLEQS